MLVDVILKGGRQVVGVVMSGTLRVVMAVVVVLVVTMRHCDCTNASNSWPAA